MIPYLGEFWRGMTAREAIVAAIDILVVAYVIYRVLLLVKGTRAAQMLIGLVLVGAGFFAAKMAELTTLTWLLDNLINYSIIFLIVIFQHDIRRGLFRAGQTLFGSGRQYEETYVFEEVIKAAEQLARSRIGGLFVFEREAELEEFFGEPGVEMDARVTKELLVALFIPEPENTVHDGAIIIKNLRVHRAGAVLPLSANAKLDKSLGTRHRAAIGITEETDAVVVVVSEERGSVSLCFGGNIAQDLDGATLRKALLGLFQKEKRAPKPRPTTVSTRTRTPKPRRAESGELTRRTTISGSISGTTAGTTSGTVDQPVELATTLRMPASVRTSGSMPAAASADDEARAVTPPAVASVAAEASVSHGVAPAREEPAAPAAPAPEPPRDETRPEPESAGVVVSPPDGRAAERS